MDFIYVKLFGSPEVLLRGQRISFPFKKVEALFYYIVVKGHATRDELVSLLWGDIEEDTARKNLRNAIYRIKKAFDIDILLSPKRDIVMLNSDINIKTDIQLFINDDIKGIEAYSGEFLEGFAVKEGECFEEWMLNKREEYKNMYMIKLYSRIREDLKGNRYESAEMLSKMLITADEFDERAYRILMKLYAKLGTFNKAIDIYNKLCEKLKGELGISPDMKTKKLYEKILYLRSSREGELKLKSHEFFYGRHNEMGILRAKYNDFIKNNISKSVLIIGEAGIGKTRLKDKFIQIIENDDIYLLETSCYQAEKEYMLKPWNAVFSKLADIIEKSKIDIPVISKNITSYLFPGFDKGDAKRGGELTYNIDRIRYQAAEEAILHIIKRVSDTKPVVLVIEDLQWMDSMSLSLLNSIIFHNENNRIFFIITCRNGYEKDVDKFAASGVRYDKLQKVILKRFTREEVEDFVNKALPQNDILKKLSNRIYEETEGNTFFMVEYLNSIKEKRDINIMSSKAQDILKSRFLEISEEGKKLLDIISIFFDEAPLDILTKIIGKDELEIIDAIGELESRAIIKEVCDYDKSSFKFTHQKLRDFVYSQQSPAKRKVLHGRIGFMLEKSLKNSKSDMALFSKLIYHFTRSGNKLLALKYSIENLNAYFDFSHELFSVVYDLSKYEEKNLYISKDEAIKQLNYIENMIEEVKEYEDESIEMTRLEMTFLHMKGRFLIREGEYGKGTLCIRNLIDISSRVNDVSYILKGYRQMIYYCIQVHNIEEMKEYVDSALAIAKSSGNHYETAILYRLKGLNKIMSGKNEEAEELLRSSIDIFTSIGNYKDKYFLNIAAAYNYIGEIRRHTMRFSSALEYYDRAIAICENKNALTGLTSFYTNAGQAAFEAGDYDRSKQYFEKAFKIFNQTDSAWGRSIAEGYMALLLVKQGVPREALNHLKMADHYSEKIKSPQETGLIYRIKAEIKSIMERTPLVDGVFKNYLNLGVDKYCDAGIELLKDIKEGCEIDILKALKRGSSSNMEYKI